MKYLITQTVNKTIWITTVCHLVFMVVLYLICTYFFSGIVLPDSQNLVMWDAQWYNSIKEFGYVLIPEAQCNMAFFPLFPIIWDALSLDALQISLLNALLFAFSFVFLMQNEKANVAYLLALLSVPSFIFFFVPYSESLFFLFGTIFLLGYNTANKWMIVIGLAGACLTRSVAIVFIPALIIAHFIHSGWNPKKILKLTLFLAAPLGAMLIVVLMQVMKTGKWFYFIEVQHYWGRYLHFPILPFDTLSPSRILRLDATALLIGFVSTYFCIEWIISQIRAHFNHTTNKVNVPPAATFSALYLAGATFANLFLSFELEGGTVLMSLNRYIFPTPFFIYFIHWLFTNTTLPKRTLYIVLGITLATFFATAYWRQPVSAIYYYIIFAVAFPLAGLLRLRFKPAYIVIYVFQVILQIILFNDLLHERWVG